MVENRFFAIEKIMPCRPNLCHNAILGFPKIIFLFIQKKKKYRKTSDLVGKSRLKRDLHA
jgi:hypothetical protein